MLNFCFFRFPKLDGSLSYLVVFESFDHNLLVYKTIYPVDCTKYTGSLLHPTYVQLISRSQIPFLRNCHEKNELTVEKYLELSFKYNTHATIWSIPIMLINNSLFSSDFYWFIIFIFLIFLILFSIFCYSRFFSIFYWSLSQLL